MKNKIKITCLLGIIIIHSIIVFGQNNYFIAGDTSDIRYLDIIPDTTLQLPGNTT